MQSIHHLFVPTVPDGIQTLRTAAPARAGAQQVTMRIEYPVGNERCELSFKEFPIFAVNQLLVF